MCGSLSHSCFAIAISLLSAHLRDRLTVGMVAAGLLLLLEVTSVSCFDAPNGALHYNARHFWASFLSSSCRLDSSALLLRRSADDSMPWLEFNSHKNKYFPKRFSHFCASGGTWQPASKPNSPSCTASCTATAISTKACGRCSSSGAASRLGATRAWKTSLQR